MQYLVALEKYYVTFPGLGWKFNISNAAIDINGFVVYWYGMLIAFAVALCLILGMKQCRKHGLTPDLLTDYCLLAIPFAFIGARLYYVIFRWGEYYSQHMNEILAIHSGGLAIYGGVIGGLSGGCIVAKKKKLPIPAILDISVMGFLIGQGLGRWGNFFNQEAFGTPTDLPWRMVSENTGGIGVHPCFLYESLWCLTGFVLLYIFSRKFRKYDGQIFLLYLVWYGAERMIVEGLRTDSLYTPFLNLRVSQILAALTMLTGIVLLILFRKKTYKAADNIKLAAQTDTSEDIAKENSQTEDTEKEAVSETVTDTDDTDKDKKE